MPRIGALRFFLSLLVALPLSLPLLYPHLLRCMLVSRSADFRRLPDRASSHSLYIRTTVSARQQTQFQAHCRAAQARISRFWGGQQGRAVLIYCPSQTDYARYCAGGEGAGCSLGTPWGDAYLVLGPEGNNVDVIAHELCHDELFSRLGWWSVKRQIPQWFNEGLALLVDYRFSSPDVWERPDSTASPVDTPRMGPFGFRPMIPLTDLVTTSDFFGGDYGHVMMAYQTAADEVARWLRRVGQPGLLALTRSVANGESFDQAYQRLEKGATRSARPGKR
ncbi:hypothetical protein HH216_12810 [Spirosoma rhododendri]|uniref:DUF1570 domain-containing protein n=2 Tax=Spirosoma rhododendri TaxID=2728024 RepID=A0A7L5DSE8_9BACT|nr:hypothetical protein HH216_12810 [Spirosoma rhododendri]